MQSDGSVSDENSSIKMKSMMTIRKQIDENRVIKASKVERQRSGSCKVNRNIEYLQRKQKKNTKKKIEKEAILRKARPKEWTTGGPRPMMLLKTLGIEKLIVKGMFYDNSDDAELAIYDHAELGNRKIHLKREGNRLRATCF